MLWIGLMIGAIIGSMITRAVHHYKTTYGKFILVPVDEIEEPGEYMVTVRIPQNANLLDKKRIILERSNSQD
nr:MAG TPA: YtxH-like protein [Caudoviricetes sp.]